MQTTSADVLSAKTNNPEQTPTAQDHKTFDGVNSGNIKRFSRLKESSKEKKVEKPVRQAASRPTKFLPSERITFSRQLDVLRGWGAASGPLRKAVSNNEVAKIVDMQPSTVSINNAFYASVSLLTKSEGGYSPAEEVTAFLRAYEWNKETAAQKLAPILSKSWFYEALASKLEFGSRSESDCLQDLGDAANASQEYKANLRILLEYLNAAGLIQRDGDMVKKGGVSMGTSTASSGSSVEPSPAPKQENPSSTSETPKMMPSLFGTSEGQVQFNVAVKVNMGEFSSWKADRIAAFFNGIAAVLAAKAKMEESD